MTANGIGHAWFDVSPLLMALRRFLEIAYQDAHLLERVRQMAGVDTRRRRRARCYQIMLRVGPPADLLRFVDGALLVDPWPDRVLPRELRTAWGPYRRSAAASDLMAYSDQVGLDPRRAPRRWYVPKI